MALFTRLYSVLLATKPVISLIILPLVRILKRNLTHSTDTFLFICHTTNVLLFKFRCNIFIGVRIIKEIPGSVASGTLCIRMHGQQNTTFVVGLLFNYPVSPTSSHFVRYKDSMKSPSRKNSLCPKVRKFTFNCSIS